MREMAEAIRILHVLRSLDRGGAETMLMNLYRQLDRAKVQFDFMVHTPEEGAYEAEIRELGGKIYRVPRYAGLNHFAYQTAWRLFLASHPEHRLVHGHLCGAASIYLGVANRFGRITVAHSHSTASRGSWLEQFAKRVLQWPLRYRADYLLACSDAAGRWLFGAEALKERRYLVLKNAIDVERYAFDAARRSQMRERLELQHKFVLGHVGSFTQPKNHRFLLEVFREVRQAGEDAMLLLVGDGELRPQVEKQLADLRLSRQVILTGVVPNVQDYLQAMDVFVFPSLFEGVPLTLLEAQASGLPCVISRAVNRESDVTGLLDFIPLEQSPALWAGRILRHHAGSSRRERRKEIAAAGYDVKENARWLESFYLKALAGGT